MKNVIKYIFIGFIQGITEFLPVSSSGHIVLFGDMLNLDNLLLLSIVAHVGTLFAVVLCYRKRLFDIVRHPKSPTSKNLILSCIPTVIMVLLFKTLLESNFNTSTLVWGFLFSAVLLLVADFKKEKFKPMKKSTALYMGIAQGCALLPGISRSGTTLACSLLVGTEKNEALDFSFLMSIPIIFASAVYEGIKIFSSPISINWTSIACVLISSFIFGILSIKIMLKVVKNKKLYIFSIYLVILSWIAFAMC